jgi:hypothetical protein
VIDQLERISLIGSVLHAQFRPGCPCVLNSSIRKQDFPYQEKNFGGIDEEPLA